MNDILFVIDRLELKYFEFNKLVTNFCMIKSLLDRGQNVYITTIDMLKLKSSIAYTSCYKSFVKDNDIFYDKNIPLKFYVWVNMYQTFDAGIIGKFFVKNMMQRGKILWFLCVTVCLP